MTLSYNKRRKALKKEKKPAIDSLRKKLPNLGEKELNALVVGAMIK
jgi:hypothetical protein